MGLSRLLPILVPFIVLWSVQELGLVEGSRSKRCPRFRIKCEVRERDQCSIRRPCPGNLKCCMYSCGKKCLDLRQGNVQPLIT
nr:WAP four-disulfide core domain protein 6 [Loxodonta africana]